MSVHEFEDGADDWMDDGACRGTPGVDPDWFFAGDQLSIARAKRVCAACPVADRCYAHAVKHREVGVWGGTDDQERTRTRRMSLPMKERCRKGHLLTPDNVHYRADGGRRCKICWRSYYKERAAAEKAQLTLVRGEKP